jgi:hypothetical protein
MMVRHIKAQLLSELAQVTAAIADDENDGGVGRVLDTPDGCSGFWYGRYMGILSTLVMLNLLDE